METKNYLQIATDLEQLVRRFLRTPLLKEDPYGKKKKYRPKSVRLVYLEHQSRYREYLNGEVGKVKSQIIPAQVLISLFYENEKKAIRVPLATIISFTGQEGGILSEIWDKVGVGTNLLMTEFFSVTSSDRELYLETEDTPVYMEDEKFMISGLSQISDHTSNLFLELQRDLYRSNSVACETGKLQYSRKLWIVVDSEGTRIIQYQDVYTQLIDAKIFSKKLFYPLQFANHFATPEEMVEYFPQLRTDIQEALNSRNRKQLQSDIYPLIFMPSAVATLFHEALAGHMLSGDLIANDISPIFKNKLGKPIAKHGSMEVLGELEIWDRPRNSSMLAFYEYDMEGVESRDVCLIRRGMLENYLLGKNSASQLKVENNGHALGETFLLPFDQKFISVAPEPRVSNLQVLSDSTLTLEEMQSEFLREFGCYYEVSTHRGEVNVETGTFELFVDFIVKVSKTGKRSYFHGGTFSANLTDFLSAICMVSNHYATSRGYCGSTSGWVPTEEYTPAMGVYGVNWAPDPLPEADMTYNLKRDKYLPTSWGNEESPFRS